MFSTGSYEQIQLYDGSCRVGFGRDSWWGSDQQTGLGSRAHVDPDTAQAGPQVSTCSAPQPGGSVGAGEAGPWIHPLSSAWLLTSLSLSAGHHTWEFSLDDTTPCGSWLLSVMSPGP